MSGIRNQNVHRAADFPKLILTAPLVTAISQTGVVAYKFLPGFKYRVVAVRSYNLLKAGTVTATVKVGTRTAASVTFTSATDVAQTLSTALANLLGSATEAVSVEYTTDGSGVLTNGSVTIVIRPWPLNGDLGQTTP